jgi:hypothetical protein
MNVIAIVLMGLIGAAVVAETAFRISTGEGILFVSADAALPTAATQASEATPRVSRQVALNVSVDKAQRSTVHGLRAQASDSFDSDPRIPSESDLLRLSNDAAE